MDLAATSVHDPADYLAFLERNPDAAPKRIIQMTSASASMTLALAAVARRGVVSWLGTPDENPVMLPKYYQQMIVKETAVLGSYSKSVQDWVDAVALAEAGAIAVPAGSADIPFGPDPVERLTELARIWPTKNRHYLVFGGAAPATEPRPA
jgi:D-arabinose 1-dehydrogenase-like Zn-dependent alcohol dehydrogenase